MKNRRNGIKKREIIQEVQNLNKRVLKSRTEKYGSEEIIK